MDKNLPTGKEEARQILRAMNAKEKAQELVDKIFMDGFDEITVSCGAYCMGGYIDGRMDAAKQCALIAVEEILTELLNAFMQSKTHKQYKYWQQVKQEIEKL